MSQALLILYVAELPRAREFYRAVLGREPVLDVPGMCEFQLTGGGSLGLMPNAGARELLGSDFAAVGESELPRAELYLRLPDAPGAVSSALEAGARLVSGLAERDWGERVAYLTDLDGHVLALAEDPADPLGPGSPGRHEAPLEAGKHDRPGWFIANLAEAAWSRNERFGSFCGFEGAQAFDGFGLNMHLLQPGQPACLYHREDCQEGFLVVRGRCIALVEDQQRELRTWDYLHCPPGTAHVLIGAGDGPSAVLMVGRREPIERLFYPESKLAQGHGAGAEIATHDPKKAYSGTPVSQPIRSPWT